jgi:hypothetical protein
MSPPLLRIRQERWLKSGKSRFKTFPGQQLRTLSASSDCLWIVAPATPINVKESGSVAEGPPEKTLGFGRRSHGQNWTVGRSHHVFRCAPHDEMFEPRPSVSAHDDEACGIFICESDYLKGGATDT